MVDIYGRWSYDPTEPKEKWCDFDRIAHWIEDQGYTPVTSMENLVVMLCAEFESELEFENKDWPPSEDLVYDISLFVEQTGTLRDFDYEC